tara:strand:- start:867 stop:1568 length:702 start_codon:yes stop_codon:yes gene_type:complete
MTQINLNKETKAQVGKAIQELYKSTLKFNAIGGNDYKDKTLFNNQLETVKSELKETIKALEDNDLGELVDGSLDLAVTISFLIAIIDGNDSITKNAPLYLNPEDLTAEELVPIIAQCIDTENYIDALGYVEDLIYQVNGDAVANSMSVAESNLSKYILAEELDKSGYSEFDICEAVNEKGRYEDVYSEVTTYNDEEWVVFKSKKDLQNNEVYPKGKIIKCILTFKEPSLVVYA